MTCITACYASDALEVVEGLTAGRARVVRLAGRGAEQTDQPRVRAFALWAADVRRLPA